MKAEYNIRSAANIIVVVLAVFFISGCLGSTFSNKPEKGQQSESQPKSRKTTAVYYDFEDILIPLELSIVKSRTVVISAPGYTSGILTLKGRLERRSLFNFFSNNMQKDNWNVISQIKSPGATIMVFQKISKTAVITIREEQLFTYVEIGVAPTVTDMTGLSETSLVE